MCGMKVTQFYRELNYPFNLKSYPTRVKENRNNHRKLRA